MNTQEFNKLLTENAEFLKPFAYSLTKCTEDAEDLVQDTMFRALINRDKYKDGTNIRAWLYTIMRNIFINNYRKRKKFQKVSSEVPADFFLFQNNKVARNEGFFNFRLNELKQKVEDLPEIFRVSFELHFLGFKYQEIAQTLEEPLGTIKSRIHFARKMLTKQIDRH